MTDKQIPPKGWDDYLDDSLSTEQGIQTALNGTDSVLRAAARLQRTGETTLSAEAKDNIWARMETAFDASDPVSPQPAPEPTNIIPMQFLSTLAKIAAVFAVIMGLTFGAQPATANALPTSWMYPIKLGFEQLELTLAQSPEAQVDVY